MTDIAGLLTAARHEAGHAWAAQCFGVTTWHIVILGPGIGSMTCDLPLDPHGCRVIGLAGLAAELALVRDLDAAALVRAASDPAQGLSASDRAFTGHVDLALADETLRLVLSNQRGIGLYAVDLAAAAMQRR